MKLKLHHVNFCTTNVPAMDAFYRDVLGLEPEPSLAAGRVAPPFGSRRQCGTRRQAGATAAAASTGYLSGCETSLAASAMRRALAMSSGPARPCGFGLASLRRALRRSAVTWFGVLPSRTR